MSESEIVLYTSNKVYGRLGVSGDPLESIRMFLSVRDMK